MDKETIDAAFPFDEYRRISDSATQYDVVAKIQSLLNDYDTIYVDAPTGTGKSPINVCCATLADSAFYTTPLKSLREQLLADSGLQPHITGLRGRRDYQCGERDENCQDCPISVDPERSCLNQSKCTYWNAKREAMDAHTAALTFAYLITDSYLPVTDESGRQLSFDDRELLIIDEMDELESQVASLFSGFTVGRNTLPNAVVCDVSEFIDRSMSTHHEVIDYIEPMVDRAGYYMSKHAGDESHAKEIEQCKRFMRKAEWMFDEIEDGRTWTVDVEPIDWMDGNRKQMRLSPVRVDNFLGEHVWSRSDKRILSTATMPLRSDTRALSNRLGLDHDKAFTLKVSMPFPTKHRPVHTEFVGNFSDGGDAQHWPAIMDKLNELAGRHEGQRGVIHTVSYSRAQKIRETVDADDYPHLQDNLYQHESRHETDAVVEGWLYSDQDILLSPSVMTGVDLYDDRCRWGVLLKTPYPHLGDSRLSHLVNEKNDWHYYSDIAARSMVQAAGRAVRHVDDYADFYLIDRASKSLLRRASFPQWFIDAVVADKEPVALAKNEPIGWKEPDILDF